MTKKLILHIGTQKTGTTSIQNYLAANRKLLAKQGVCYPVDLGGYRAVAKERNAHVLDRAAVGRAKPSAQTDEDRALVPAQLKRLRGHMKRYDTLLLSDERIWSDGTAYKKYWPNMHAVISELGFDEVELILYLRRQDHYCESRWNQVVKCGVSATGDIAWLLQERPSYARSNFYGEYLDKVEAEFGRQNIHVRIFERPKLVNGDAVDDFMQVAGLSADERFVRPQNANPTLTCNCAQIKRWANEAPTCRKLGDNFLRGAISAVSAASAEAPSSVFTPEERTAFLAQFEAGNERLARDYFGMPGAELFDTSKPDPPAWKADPLSLQADIDAFFTAALHGFPEPAQSELLTTLNSGQVWGGSWQLEQQEDGSLTLNTQATLEEQHQLVRSFADTLAAKRKQTLSERGALQRAAAAARSIREGCANSGGFIVPAGFSWQLKRFLK